MTTHCVYCGGKTRLGLACWSHLALLVLDPHYRLPDQWRLTPRYRRRHTPAP